MSGAMSLLHSTQAQNDIRRIMGEMTDLQRQIASGAKANDLAGFGGASTRFLSAKGLQASAEARGSVLTQLDARLGVQASALSEAASASTRLALSLRQAVSAGDGQGIAAELQLSFLSIVNSMNESWNGQPLFAGERQDGVPVKVSSLDELPAANSNAELFDEAERQQTIDIGWGAPIPLSRTASEISSGLFGTLRDLKILIDNSGGSIGQPISGAESQQLLYIASALEAESRNLNTEEGRVGQLQARFAEERIRLQQRADLLTKEIGEHADADLGQVSIRLSALMVQYEASAKTFSDLSQLSLLRYL
jgi:flagellar hook-associated protein 3 FlgL